MCRLTLSLTLAAVAVLAPGGSSQAHGPTLEPPEVARRPVPLRLQTPVRIAVGPAGEVLVTDYELDRVCAVGIDGRTVGSSFPVGDRPTALGVLGERILVGSEGTGRVRIHGPDGEPLGTLGGSGFAFGDPRDLAVDAAANRVYVLDGLARQVKVFDMSLPEGLLAGTIGAPGTVSSTFQNPTALTLDPLTQEVFVSDFGGMNATTRPRVLVFGYDGTFHDWISGEGGPTGQYFARPQGLLIGASGHLFVVDCWRGEVVVMDRQSEEQVASLGAWGTGPGQLLLPLDLAVAGDDGDLLVTSASSHRVVRFAGGGESR